MTSTQSASASTISSAVVPGGVKATVAAIHRALYGVGKTCCLSRVNPRSASFSAVEIDFKMVDQFPFPGSCWMASISSSCTRNNNARAMSLAFAFGKVENFNERYLIDAEI